MSFRLDKAKVGGMGLLVWSFVVLLVGVSLDSPAIVEWEVYSTSSCYYSVVVALDWLSMSFGWVVAYISSMVLFYSSSYMSSERYLSRFVWMVFFFILSMNCLIFVPSIWGVMLGWDGLGITSFVLVVYYQNSGSLSAGMLTALTNRVGDVFLILAIYMFFSQGQFGLKSVEGVCVSSALVFVSIASITKSAQFPFCSWLPAAMAAPTPVSALVHSSTLVTAGVYLLVRLSSSLGELELGALTFLSCFTLLLSSMSANVEHDLKKVVALSTLSQLAMMVLALSVGYSFLAFFHLLVHALLKALLFMAVGSIMHGFNGVQDVRYMGGAFYSMPLTVFCFCVANLALCGFPFVGAFYSKDLIVEGLLSGGVSLVVIITVLLSAGLSVSYSLRLSYLAVFSYNKGSCFSNSVDKVGEVLPMLGLAVGAVCGGVFFQSIFLGFIEFFFMPTELKLVLLVVLLGALVGSLLCWSSSKSKVLEVSFSEHLLSTLGFLSPLSSQPLAGKCLRLSGLLYKQLDQGWMELISGEGAFLAIKKLGVFHHRYQSMRFNAGVGGVLLFGVLVVIWLLPH
uniref:NADH-ubiquinone oxidoreductase chain 5 n=1 Tax=Bryopa lata TaxID=1969317 RepID=A0A1U9XPC8_9BIVA|nr:NADH dehydrogenase subunit 5 [Bryopa lata]AQZ26105.1 NADH dehydrogenase subunit 5 [Bryopa lata]